MGREAIWVGIYNLLIADQILLNLLGPLTTQNFRVYRSWPQTQPLLTSYEPEREGWLVIDEPDPSLKAMSDQITTAWEVVEPTISVFATDFALADDISDRIDLSLHWSVEQQRDLTFEERIVLFTRRYKTSDSYSAETKLYRKDIVYKVEMIVTEQIA